MTNDNEELKVIYSALEDCRRLIAAGKVQRWDVVKWGVTVNVALATAVAAVRRVSGGTEAGAKVVSLRHPR